MKILFDLSALSHLNVGVANYAIYILKGFQDKGITDITLLVNKDIENIIQTEFPEYETICFQKKESTILHILKLRAIVNGLRWKKTVDTSGCDILFSPYSTLFYIWKPKIREVQTRHDILGLRAYKGLTKYLHRVFTPFILGRSDAVICISDHVRQDLLNTYRFIKPQKLRTIYNSVIIPSELDIKPDIDSNYILYVNTLCEYKNILTLLRAYRLIRKNFDHKLVIIGKETPYWHDEVLPYIRQNNLVNDIIHLPFVSPDDLVGYYKNASLFVTTSLHEGFGYTPVEAAICAVPVISCKETALYETTCGLLNYYEPAMDGVALADKMAEVLRCPPSEEELRNISMQLSEKYNYLTQASLVYDYISDVYNHH